MRNHKWSVQRSAGVEEINTSRCQTRIVWDADRVIDLMHCMDNGLDVNFLLGFTCNEPLVSRTIRLQDKMRLGLTFLTKTTAGPSRLDNGTKKGTLRPGLGLIKRKATVFNKKGEVAKAVVVLNEKGERLIQETYAWYLSHADKKYIRENETAEQAAERYAQYNTAMLHGRLLNNEEFWVRVDHKPISLERADRVLDLGMVLYEELMPLVLGKKRDAAIQLALALLAQAEDASVIQEALEDQAILVKGMFPCVDSEIVNETAELDEILLDSQRGLDYQDIMSTIRVEMGVQSKNRWTHELRQAQRKKFLSIQELWDTVLYPMIESYTNRPFGSDRDFINLPLTEAEEAEDRDDYPATEDLIEVVKWGNRQVPVTEGWCKENKHPFIAGATRTERYIESVTKQSRYGTDDSGLEMYFQQLEDKRTLELQAKQVKATIKEVGANIPELGPEVLVEELEEASLA